MRQLLKMKRFITLYTFIMFSYFLIGTADANFLSALMPTYTLSGKIVNQNQEPIEGVTVVFEASGIGGQSKAVTDSLGNYVIHPMAKTSGLLTIRKENYRIIREQIGNYYVAGTSLVNNYSLHPDWISGKVINQNREPVEGAKVSIEEDGGMSGVATVTTDENGNFRCAIPTDSKQYWITIKKDGYQVTRDHTYLYGGQTWNYTLKW